MKCISKRAVEQNNNGHSFQSLLEGAAGKASPDARREMQSSMLCGQ